MTKERNAFSIRRPVGRPRLRETPLRSNVHATENDNLRSEYLPLFQDVPPSISEMSAALGREPDAINFWLGDSSSVTSLHRDNYENIYAQIRGSKTFVLLSPLEAACVNEQFLPCATYTKKENTWYIVLDEPDGKVPVALWDPDNPEENATEFTKFSQPLRIRLEEGDLLYLPACWSADPPDLHFSKIDTEHRQVS